MMASAVVVGTIIGSGVFKKAGTLAQPDHTPYSLLIISLWIAGGVLTFLGALAYAEVVCRVPRAGGNFAILQEAYGPLWGFLWGWVDFVIIRAASLAALSSVFIDSLCSFLMPSAPMFLRWFLSVAVLLFLTAVNVRGTKLSGVLQVVITLVKVGSLTALAALPLWCLLVPGFEGHVNQRNLYPIWPADDHNISFTNVFNSFLAIVWAYHGWQNIAPVAEEVKHPQRNIPLSLLFGVGLVTLLYVTVNLAYHLLLPMSTIREVNEGVVALHVLWSVFGDTGLILGALAVSISTFGALNGNLLAGPRLLYSMAQEGMAPAALQRLHPQYETPALAIVVLGCWGSILILLGGVVTYWTQKTLFDLLTNFAMFGAVIFETMAVLAIFYFRQLPNPESGAYRCPGYPLTPLLYTLLPVGILINMTMSQQMECLAGLGFLLGGVAVYWIAIRPQPAGVP